MTSTITRAVENFIVSNSVEQITTSVGLVPVALLVVLLVQQELVRAVDGPRLRSQMRAMNAVILPLLCSFAVVVVTRAIDLIQD